MRYFLLFPFVLCSLVVNAQSDCEYHYYRNKVASTSVCYGKGFEEGKARAFDIAGKVIYEKSIRKFAGHSSVVFSWYESGAVKKAEWSEAPDAGIQWYRSITTFSEDGKVLDVEEQNYEGLHSPAITKRLPDTSYRPKPAKKKEVVKCAVIYSSEFWFINRTKYNVIAHADKKSGNDESAVVRLKPGASAKGGAMILAEQFENPERYYYFSVVQPGAGRKKQPVIRFLREEQDSKTKRRYYFEIR